MNQGGAGGLRMFGMSEDRQRRHGPLHRRKTKELHMSLQCLVKKMHTADVEIISAVMSTDMDERQPEIWSNLMLRTEILDLDYREGWSKLSVKDLMSAWEEYWDRTKVYVIMLMADNMDMGAFPAGDRFAHMSSLDFKARCIVQERSHWGPAPPVHRMPPPDSSRVTLIAATIKEMPQEEKYGVLADHQGHHTLLYQRRTDELHWKMAHLVERLVRAENDIWSYEHKTGLTDKWQDTWNTMIAEFGLPNFWTFLSRPLMTVRELLKAWGKCWGRLRLHIDIVEAEFAGSAETPHVRGINAMVDVDFELRCIIHERPHWGRAPPPYRPPPRFR